MSESNSSGRGFGIRRMAVLVLGAAAAMLMAASVAYACGPSATMGLDATAGAPGTTVTGAGYNFSKAGEAGLTDATAELHWHTRDGAVLWSGTPAEDGSLDISFTVPDVAPGHYLVIVYQQSEEGVTPGRQPARARFQVTAASASSVAPAAVEEPASAAPPAPAAEHTAPAPATDQGAAPAAAVDVTPVAPPPAPAAEQPVPAAAVEQSSPAASAPATIPAQRRAADVPAGSPASAAVDVGVAPPLPAATWPLEVIAALGGTAATEEAAALAGARATTPSTGSTAAVDAVVEAAAATARAGSGLGSAGLGAALAAALAGIAAYAAWDRRRRLPPASV